MSTLHEMLGQLLQPGAIQGVSEKAGVDAGTAATLISSALPLLVGGLAKNAASADGASALASALRRDHDGSVLDNLSGFLGSGQAASVGSGILGHVFGGRTDTMASALGRTAGVDAGQAGQVLAMLAPLVLGALGRSAAQDGLGAEGLAGQLQSERSQLESGSPFGALITNLLDKDGDGSVMDDVADMAKRFFS